MRRRTKFGINCVVLGLCAVPALAAAQEGCKPLTEFKKLPALSALLDSAAVVADLPTPEANAPSEIRVSVLTGATPQVHAMDSAALGAKVVEKVLASLKPGARNSVPAFRVHIILAQPVSATVEPSVLCDPKTTGAPPRQASFMVASPAGAPPVRPRSVSPRIKIGVNGEVLQVDLGAGTGFPEGDRSIRQALEGQRYEPALLDGRPVQVWWRDRKVELVR